MKVKEESEKVGLKLNVQKPKVMAQSHLPQDGWPAGTRQKELPEAPLSLESPGPAWLGQSLCNQTQREGHHRGVKERKLYTKRFRGFGYKVAPAISWNPVAMSSEN